MQTGTLPIRSQGVAFVFFRVVHVGSCSQGSESVTMFCVCFNKNRRRVNKQNAQVNNPKFLPWSRLERVSVNLSVSVWKLSVQKILLEQRRDSMTLRYHVKKW
jgi:hypothetical protein